MALGRERRAAGRVDLHVHSTASDGAWSPTAVVRAAAAAGLTVLAVADHDTTAGVREAQAAGARCGVEVIPALEVTARDGSLEVHLLGYGVDLDAPALRALEERAAQARRARVTAMLDRLEALGCPVTWEAVAAAAGGAVSVGRPHVARAMVAAGWVPTVDEAFARYLGEGRPAFVAGAFPSVAEAIAAIRAANGLAVWAHPPLEGLVPRWRRYRAWGLAGVEVWRPEVDPGWAERMARWALSDGLVVTGGSDWHRPGWRAIGDFDVAAARLARFWERLACACS